MAPMAPSSQPAGMASPPCSAVRMRRWRQPLPRSGRSPRFDWPDGLALRVRMGLHTGEAHERDGNYFGPAVNRAARVMDAANGSQILLSASTREVVGHELGDGDDARRSRGAGAPRRRRARAPLPTGGPGVRERPATAADGRRARRQPADRSRAAARTGPRRRDADRRPRAGTGRHASPARAGSARPGWRWRWAGDSRPLGVTASGSPRSTPSTGRTRWAERCSACSASSLARNRTWTP